MSCNRDQTYVEQGLDKEKKGNYAEALHYYNQAYKINPENKFANERLGFLLSESQFSIIPAIFHLEKAREKDQNNEMVTLKLIDLTLFISDFTKGKRLQKELSTQLEDADNLFITRITECLETLKSMLAIYSSLFCPKIDLQYYYTNVVLILYTHHLVPDLQKILYRNPRRPIH